MLSYMIRRTILTIPKLLCVSILIFLLVHFIPGDPAMVIVGNQATPEQIQEIREDLGLNEPLMNQYLNYLNRIIRFDFGKSLRTRARITQEFSVRLPYTAFLSVSSIILAGIIGILIGVISAIWKYSFFDHFFMVFALTGVSMPIFWVGIVFIWIFSLKLGVLPSSGVPDSFTNISELRYCILPVITLSWTLIGMVARLTRSSMMEIINKDYIRTAKAKGLTQTKVMAKHALRNAVLPVITYLGLQFGFLLGGAVVTEQIFAWPGVGRYLLQAVLDRDYPVIQSTILLFALIFIVVNLLVDLSYSFIDPRITYH